MIRCGVLGDPIAHSLSPALHRAAYAATDLDWEYDAVRVPAGGLARFVADCLADRGDSWRGLSLTMPLKREAAGLADTVTDTVRAAGAANTLVLRDGSVHGDNTDVPGAVAALGERGITALGSATILGGGATATSVGLALAGLGLDEVTLLMRSATRGAETVERLETAGLQVRVGDLASAPVAGDLVVSTIPVDAQDDGLIVRCSGVPAVFEVVYDPWPSPLAADAQASDRTLVSGLDLLAHQAALQFALFTGLETAPVDVMRSAGEVALAARR